MRSKHLRAALRNSLLNSSISLAARAASSSRLAARSASLFLRASSIAASLRGTPTGEPRETRRRSRGRGDGVLLRHQQRASPRRRRPKFSGLPKAHHSTMSMWRSRSCRASGERRLGAPGPAEYWRFLLPQLIENLIAFWCYSVPLARVRRGSARRLAPAAGYPTASRSPPSPGRRLVDVDL